MSSSPSSLPSPHQQDNDNDDDDLPPDYIPPPPPSPPPIPTSPMPTTTERNHSDSVSSFHSINLNDDDHNHQSQNNLKDMNVADVDVVDNNNTNTKKNGFIDLNKNLSPKKEFSSDKQSKNENDDTDSKNEKKSPENKTESVFFLKLFKYATTLDKIFICFGSIFAFSLGLAFPIMILLMGKITDTFITFEIFRGFASAPDQSERFNYYENVLKDETNVTKYFELIAKYYIDNYNQSSINEIGSQTGLTIEQLVEIFNNSIFQNGTLYVDQFSSDSGLYALYMALTAIGFAILDYFALGLWEQAARNQNFKIKQLFFRSIIHQDISWFDMKSSGDFATKITNDLNLVKDGMGDKIALTIMAFSTLVFSIGIAFYHGWELTLVSMAVMPVLAIAFTIIGKIQVKFASSDSESYSRAGAIAEEVINLIRTVYAFGGQKKEIERYRLAIEPAKKNGVRRSMITGISLGLMYFGIYASYGLSFWYGVNLIIRSIENHETPPKYQASTMFIVFFNVLMGAFSLGQTAPYFESIAKACGAAGSIFKIMERKPIIDSLSQEGKRIQIKGKVQFRNVHFNYPNRKEVKILNGLNLDAESGQTIALVGSSGCGKSTIIQLIQRFYDPDSGQILIDDIDIKQLNVGQLRDQIGVVGQEPVLFDYSIKENIAMGNPEANFDDVVKAAKEANAYDFIQNLPDKFETIVGDRGGAQLSGGQKQRIATARALIRNPKILLLDEATSALDSESEAIVQAALDKASCGRTTFIVAHRLSTIRNADKIILIDQGRIKEIGTHQELIDAKGIYYNMARLQYQDQEQEPNKQELIAENNNQINQRKKFERSKSTDTVKSSKKGFNDNEKDQENSIKDDNQSLPIKRLMKFVHPDRYLLIIATIFSFINGLTIPIYSFVFGEVLGILHLSDVDYMRGEILKYSLIFLTMGILAGLFQFLQSYLYGISSENLTFRLRNEVFSTILTQEIAYFDEPNNSTGALCARLSNDASAVQGATGSRLSVIAQTVSILTAGVILSMIYCWKLSLVMLCFVPVIIISIYYQMKILMGMSITNRKSTEQATKIAVESISNIRTVASLHLELKFLLNYMNALEIDFRKSRWEPHIKSLAFGLTQMVFNMAYAIALYYGSRLIITGELEYSELFKCTEAVLFGTNMIGQSVAFSPDYQKGKLAAINVFKLLDRVPKILTNSIFGVKLSKCNGQVKFNNVEFRYPTRPKVRVLNRISFEIEQGQTIALVGSSGCGKSTCTQILERFYDIQNGQVEVDGQNIQQLNIDWLRSQMGIVSQEPMLFDKTIAENIAYGDNTRKIEMQEIVRAAEQANIHKFIKDLPNGYETSVGDKGAQLSGGQKQRVAIARALIRNPKILLLDEATSALDSESEKIVQEALDEARNGRTCLIIAHRLSTIRDVDMIFVMEKGLIAECGKHEQLLEQRGLYYQMYMAQCGANH